MQKPTSTKPPPQTSARARSSNSSSQVQHTTASNNSDTGREHHTHHPNASSLWYLPIESLDLNSNKRHNVAAVSFLLGAAFASSLTLAITFYSSKYFPLFLFVSFSSLYHLLEYMVVAMYNPANLLFESFMLNPDGNNRYSYSLLLAIVEFILEAILLAESKNNRIMFYTGLLLVFSGQFIRTCAMCTAKVSFNHYIVSHKDSSHTLITHGIYRYERHPSYIGFFFWATGLQVMLQNPISLAVYIAVLGRFFISRIKYEEHTLIRLFGADYIKYKKEVPTLIPFSDA